MRRKILRRQWREFNRGRGARSVPFWQWMALSSGAGLPSGGGSSRPSPGASPATSSDSRRAHAARSGWQDLLSRQDLGSR